MILLPPVLKLTDTLFPYTTLFRAQLPRRGGLPCRDHGKPWALRRSRAPQGGTLSGRDPRAPRGSFRCRPRPAAAAGSGPHARQAAAAPAVSCAAWKGAAAFSIALSGRSEEPPSELQSLMRISYAVFCLQ